MKLRPVYEGRKKDCAVQDLNVLYVVSTRARHELYNLVFRKARKSAPADAKLLDLFSSCERGTPAGIWKTYYDDGKLLEECPYQDGLKQGTCRQYFTDHSLKSEVNFVKGKLEGPAVFYYPNGKIMLTGKSVNDLREGTWTAYKDSGEKEHETEYKAGVVINEKYYDKAREAELKNDVKAIPE